MPRLLRGAETRLHSYSCVEHKHSVPKLLSCRSMRRVRGETLFLFRNRVTEKGHHLGQNMPFWSRQAPFDTAKPRAFAKDIRPRRTARIEPGDSHLMEVPPRAKETKTADEIAAMILQDLLNMDGCPRHGVSVTVYGIPWKAMLTFGVAAGPVRNKAELQMYLEAIVERLQRLYEVAL